MGNQYWGLPPLSQGSFLNLWRPRRSIKHRGCVWEGLVAWLGRKRFLRRKGFLPLGFHFYCSMPFLLQPPGGSSSSFISPGPDECLSRQRLSSNKYCLTHYESEMKFNITYLYTMLSHCMVKEKWKYYEFQYVNAWAQSHGRNLT